MSHLLTLYFIAVASMTLHEYAHAWTATRLGDPTPRLEGRLSLNPFRHLRAHGLGFHPMPIDRHRLSQHDFELVILAGLLANVLLAIVGTFGWNDLTTVNLALFFMNMIPLRPLDGFWLLRSYRYPG